jgi:hypothetical protein
MQMLQSLFYLTIALHISGLTITHLQEHSAFFHLTECNLLFSSTVSQFLKSYIIYLRYWRIPKHMSSVLSVHEAYSLITQNRTNYYHHVQPQNQSVVCLISLFRYSYVFLLSYTLFPKQFGEFTLFCWLIVAKHCLGSDPSRSTPSMKMGNVFIFSFLWPHPA